MDRAYSYIIGRELDNDQLFDLIRRPYVCEWCGTSKVPERRRGKTIVPNDRWIETPLRREEPRWVCITCFLDVYCACNSLRFEDSPDRRLVANVAASELMTTDEFRRRVWEHQLSVLDDERRAGRYDSGHAGLERKLKRLLLGEA